MTIDFRVRGSERKKLGWALSEYTGMVSTYNGIGKQTYSIGDLTILKDGQLEIPEDWSKKEIKDLLQFLKTHGYVTMEDDPKSVLRDPNSEVEYGRSGLVVTVPMDSFTTQEFQNLMNLIEAKGDLIKKALDLPVLECSITDDEQIEFHWTKEDVDPLEASAVSHLIGGMCKLAREQKRVTAKAKPVENEKYAFRCFLLRLGFIGPEFKDERRVLLHRLSGSSSYKGGAVA